MSAKWLTIKEVKELTGWSRSTVLRYIKLKILDTEQVRKHAKTYIDYYSIPTFIRERGEK